MKTIKLKSIALENFKGVASATYQFEGNSNIAGSNGSGKSTIAEAYHWCLFNCGINGGEIKVIPLDQNNEPKHDLVTSVTVELTVDNMPVTLTHKVSEDIAKARGTNQLVCKGYKNDYFVNSVPVSKTEYVDKLSEFCEIKDWLMLTNINILPNMAQKDRRKILTRVSEGFNEAALIAEYPAIAKAVAEGKTLDALERVNRETKAKTKAEIDVVPARIDEVEKTRVEDDFEAVEKELKSVKAEVIALQEKEMGITYTRTSSVNFMEQLQEQDKIIETTTNDAITKRNAHRTELERQIQTISLRIKQAEDTKKVLEEKIAGWNRMIETDNERIIKLRGEYQRKNAEVYSGSLVCPTCGQDLPEEQIAKAKEVWNAAKAAELKRLIEQATQIKENTAAITATLESDKATLAETMKKVTDLSTELDAILKERAEVMTDLQLQQWVSEQPEVMAALDEIAAIKEKMEEAKKADAAANADKLAQSAEIRKKVQTFNDQVYTLTARLSGREKNAAADKRQAELRERLAELGQTLTDCENIEDQIAAFKKRKIEMVEASVSKLFTMIRWKMYEPNLTTVGESEICQAIIDGVPYEQQNRATQINAAVDMVNGIASGLDVSVPLFIDNAESATEIIRPNAQRITLTVVSEAELTITNNI